MKTTFDHSPPATLEPKAAQAAWESIEKPRLDRDRYAFLAILSSVSSIVLAIAIIFMMPLKTTVPWIVETEASGKTTVKGPALDSFNPTQNQIIYFARTWTESLWTVDKALTQRMLETAYAMTKGKASDVFRQHMASYRPIERSASDPTLSATVQVKSINFVSERTMLIRFSVTERRKEKPTQEELYSTTLHWTLSPPSTVEEIMVNPIGFFITDFSWTREVNNAQ